MSFSNLFSTPWGWGLLVSLILINLINMTPSAIFAKLLTIPAIIVAITLHEFAHAFVAVKLGDDLPRKQGRLTLNPLKHLDPIGCVMLLLAGFGWGKPVNTNPYNYRRTISMKKGNALVALAGPAMNFALALVFAIIYGVLSRFNGSFWTAYGGIGEIIKSQMQFFYSINIALGAFNLIPLPPLDGSKILIAILPEKASDWYMMNQDYLYIAFVILWICPFSGKIINPIINFAALPFSKLIDFIIQI